MYRPNFYESTCLRCKEIVYQVDRIGPLKDFSFFHAGCFKCVHCGTKLTLKTYYNNQHKNEDKEVNFYIQTHNYIIRHTFFYDFICCDRSIVTHMCRKVVLVISIKHL